MRILGELDELSCGTKTLAALHKLAYDIASIVYPDARSVAYWTTFKGDTFKGDDGVVCFAFTVNYHEDK